MDSAAHPLMLDFGSVLSRWRFGTGSGGGDFFMWKNMEFHCREKVSFVLYLLVVLIFLS